MDLATGLGILGGIVTICAIIIIDGGNFAAFYDKHAVIIIFGVGAMRDNDFAIWQAKLIPELEERLGLRNKEDGK